MNHADVIYTEVLRRAATGVLPPEHPDPVALLEAMNGDEYLALDCAVSITRARAAVVPRYFAARARLRAA